MKTKHVFIVSLLAIGLTSQAQQLPDPSFEDWSGTPFDDSIQLNDWHASNMDDTNYRANFSHRDTGRVDGYCIRVQNQDVASLGIAMICPGFVTLGQPWYYQPSITQINNATRGVDGGITFTHRPDSMVVWIKRTGNYSSAEDFNLLFYSWTGISRGTSYKAGSNNNCTSTTHSNEESDIRQALDGNACGTSTQATQVAEGWLRERQEYTDWTRVAVPIYYMNDQVPQMCNVILSAGNYPNFRANSGMYVGHSLYVDDIQLIYCSTIQELYINGNRWEAFDPTSSDIQIYEEEITGTPEIYAMRGAGTLTNTRNTSVEFPGRRLTDSELQVTFDDSNRALITVHANDSSSTTTYWVQFRPSSTPVQEVDTCILASGYCGAEGDSTNLTWTLSCDSVLTISGTGEMVDFSYGGSPWYSQGNSIKTVIVEEGVTNIGKNAFIQCTQISSVYIANSVKVIGYAAFGYCAAIDAVVLGDSLTTIEDYAFSRCTGLPSITIPKNVSSISYYAFHHCLGLTSMVVDPENPTYDSRDSCNAIIETATNTLVEGCAATVIPNTVTSIGDYAFYECPVLTTVTIPNSVTSIGSSAFGACENITSIHIGSGLTSLIPRTFRSNSLTSIVIDAGNSKYDSRDNCNAIIETSSNTLVLGCATTIIPESVTNIGDNAFYDCENLTSIIIPNSVKRIENYAFYNCMSLRDFNIPDSLTYIGNSAFYSCAGLTNLSIPKNVTYIGSYAFYRWYNLEGEITIPSAVTYIGQDAFSDCPKVSGYVVDSTNTTYDSRDNCNAVIETATNTLVVACYNSVIPNSVTHIGFAAFSGQTNMTQIEIPANVINIGSYAFCNIKFTSIVNHATIPQEMGGSVFFNLNTSTCTLYVPEESIELYQNATEWKDFPNIQAIPGTEVIPCPQMEDIYVTDSIAQGESYVFNGRTLTDEGIYFDTIQSVDGCDSIAYTLQLTFASSDTTIHYQEPIITIFGGEVVITDSTGVELEVVDLLGDSTLIYTPEDNTLTFNSVTMEAGDSITAAISYTGTEPLTIVLCDSSTIIADTVIASTADIVVTGEGYLVAEAVVPIVGVPTATIIFDSVNMYVRSLPSPASVRRRIRGIRQTDENGGPALSGFASADFNKTVVTPPEADYGEIEASEAPGLTESIYALYIPNSDGTKTILTEFELTAVADPIDAVEQTRSLQPLDLQRPVYNILGMPVDASYRGIVIQNGQTYLR